MKTITINDIKNVWLTDDAIHIETFGGKQAKEFFSDFPRLKFATPEQRKQYTLEHFGIRWKALDEDLSYEGFFRKKAAENPIAETFKNLYGINVSALARRAGLSQSVMASYICGIKKPSETRKKKIEKTLHEIGKELLAVRL